MYNTKQKCWISASYDESHLIWCREPFNRENPAAMFDLADSMLEQAERGKQNAEAVYLMESAAKLGYEKAALAMGQLFEHGWAVQRNLRMAEQWYEKAAALGSTEAASLLTALKRRRKTKRLVIVLAVFVLIGAVVCAMALSAMFAPVDGIIVHSDTLLITPTTTEEFQTALNDLIVKYDDELVISGQRSSNRLLLMFEGSGIDLSAFPAATVIADQDNYLVVQFTTEEEAQRCLEALQTLDTILFADMDEYMTNDAQTGVHATSGVPYTSPHSGEVYYSWGVEYLGLDQLAAWLKTQQTDAVTVAVLDTGFEPCAENRHRYLDGIDMNNPSASAWTDDNGHGTHVAGTVIDCTWGLDVQILPVRVFLPGAESGAPESYVVEGLRYAIQNGADVINMSLGGRCNSTAPGDSCGNAKDYFVNAAIERDIVVVVAAGNGDEYGNPEDTGINCPAHIDQAIVVAACDSTDRLASFSNYGEAVDVAAPGVDIISYYPGDALAPLGGTSMAAPHVSALAAMLKMYLPDRTPAQIEKYITDYCVAMADTQGYGEGIPWAGYFAGN